VTVLHRAKPRTESPSF